MTTVSVMDWLQLALLIIQPLAFGIGFMVLRLNDLRHLTREVEEIKRLLAEHLQAHLEHRL